MSSDGLRQRYAAPLFDQYRPLDAFSRHYPAMAIKSEDEEYDPLLATWESEVYSEYQRRTASLDVPSKATGYRGDSLSINSLAGASGALRRSQPDDSVQAVLSRWEERIFAHERRIAQRYVATRLLSKGDLKKGDDGQCPNVPNLAGPAMKGLSEYDVCLGAYMTVGLRQYIPSGLNPVWKERKKRKQYRALIRQHPGYQSLRNTGVSSTPRLRSRAKIMALAAAHGVSLMQLRSLHNLRPLAAEDRSCTQPWDLGILRKVARLPKKGMTMLQYLGRRAWNGVYKSKRPGQGPGCTSTVFLVLKRAGKSLSHVRKRLRTFAWRLPRKDKHRTSKRGISESGRHPPRVIVHTSAMRRKTLQTMKRFTAIADDRGAVVD